MMQRRARAEKRKSIRGDASCGAPRMNAPVEHIMFPPARAPPKQDKRKRLVRHLYPSPSDSWPLLQSASTFVLGTLGVAKVSQTEEPANFPSRPEGPQSTSHGHVLEEGTMFATIRAT